MSCVKSVALALSLLVLASQAQQPTQEQINAMLQQNQTTASSSQAAVGNIGPQDFDLTEKLNSFPGQPGEPVNAQYPRQPRHGQMLPGEMDIALLLPSPEQGLPPPYGANLFAGGYESERVDGLSEDYSIAVGDKINIWLWGAVNYNSVVTVDNQGNIFIPNVGPINVLNMPASQINQVVTSGIRRVYKANVEIYVNLLTSTPISVYLSGAVVRPGQYAGMASDSILYFLKRAGGIDFDRGSFRQLQVLRKGELVYQADLYQFLQKGQLTPFAFKDNDVIFIPARGTSVSVFDGASNPFRFELLSESTDGKQLIQLARPLPDISHAAVVGSRSNGPFSVYLPLEQFADFTLGDGDRVVFNDDWSDKVYDIQVAGVFEGPSHFVVKRHTRLHDLLNHIEIDPVLADYPSIYLLRPSVAQQQKDMIEQALDRLERSVFSAPIQSTGEGQIRAQEASLVADFIARSRQVQPLGKVVVAENGNVANILLEQGDTIVIPAKTDLVHIAGEVMMPQSFVFNPNASIQDYVAWAGGYSERADDDHILIVKANGLALYNSTSDLWFNTDTSAQLQAGDQIVVLPKVDVKTMQVVKDISQIIFQLAVARNAIID